MELFIVRHGIAQDRDDPTVRSDGERELTREGRDKTALAAEGLKRMGCRPELIAASPLVRAQQTAEVIAEVLCPEVAVQTCEGLGPGGGTGEIIEWLRPLAENSVMLVGHMPNVAETTGVLLAGRASVEMVFKKAATCCILFDGAPEAGRGVLKWLLQQRELRARAEK